VDRSDEPRANRLQGKASIEFLGWAEWSESPRIGYAPLESRTKRWANEPQIEGWFLLPSGERQGCEGLSDCGTDPTNAPTLNRRTGNPNNADACGQKMGRWRVVDVCLDRWPHRRKFNRPIVPKAEVWRARQLLQDTERHGQSIAGPVSMVGGGPWKYVNARMGQRDVWMGSEIPGDIGSRAKAIYRATACGRQSSDSSESD
jgi:hypothetical protein